MSASGLRSEAAALRDACPAIVPAFVRARGRISVEAARRGARSVRADVHESGALRVRFPREHLQRLDATLVNVAGGMTGGDVFDLDFRARQGAELFISSAAAEKIYRSDSVAAEVSVHLAAEAGASCIWLPQETIVFNGARLVRKLDADIDPDARLLACEMTILGRAAMAEPIDVLSWRERWRIRRAGRLVLAEDTRVDGDAASHLARRAIGHGAHCFATLLYMDERAAEICEAMRKLVVDGDGCEAGVSTFDGLTVARFAARDGASLRASVMRCVSTIESMSLPRGWHT